MMTLDQYYSYKIVVRKLMTYGRLNRLKPLAHAATGKEQYKDICVEGNHTTHKQKRQLPLLQQPSCNRLQRQRYSSRSQKPLKEEETKNQRQFYFSRIKGKKYLILQTRSEVSGLLNSKNAIRDEENDSWSRVKS
jgi:hypothetical protein